MVSEPPMFRAANVIVWTRLLIAYGIEYQSLVQNGTIERFAHQVSHIPTFASDYRSTLLIRTLSKPYQAQAPQASLKETSTI